MTATNGTKNGGIVKKQSTSGNSSVAGLDCKICGDKATGKHYGWFLLLFFVIFTNLSFLKICLKDINLEFFKRFR